MAHLVEKMMYNSKNELPWHGLGNPVDGLATSADAISKAGLDWSVDIKPAYANVGDQYVEVNGVNFTVRSSDNRVLGQVGDRYNVLQNKQAFEFFDAIVGEEQAIYETAGSLRNGERIWLLAKMPDFIRIGNTDDIVEKYVLLTNSHDGKSPVIVKVTPIRVVCNNTLTFALSKGGDEYRVRHTTNMMDKLAEAENALGFTNTIYNQVDEILNGMSRVQMNGDMVDDYLKKVFGESNKAKNIKTDVLQLLEEGAGVDDPSLRYTAYHVYNGVTEWVDHVKNFSKNTDRLEAITFGSGASIKNKALAMATALI